MENQICKKCKKRPVYQEHSKFYCFRCYETRRNGNIKYRNAHKQENVERTRAWQKAHPEKVKEYHQKAKSNPARVLVSKLSKSEWKKTDAGIMSRKRYLEKSSEKRRLWQSEYYQKNKDRVDRKSKKWLAENPGKSSEYVKRYREKHPEQVTKSSRRRREAFKSVVGTFTLDEWKSLCNSFENKCLWCGSSQKKLTVDHVVPISKGGSGYIENIQPLCTSCNSRKNKRIIDFRPFGSIIMDWT